MTYSKCSNQNLIKIAAAVLSLVLSIPAYATEPWEETDEATGSCTFARQMREEHPRKAYENELKKARDAANSRFGETFTYTVQMRLKDGDIIDIDTFSVDCLSCHDGVNARTHDIRVKNSQHSGPFQMSNVLGSHPIGMDYGSYAYGGQRFKHMSMLKPGMELIDGKVGCLTCHNPLNPKKNHLVTDNDRSNLCYSCHRV